MRNFVLILLLLSFQAQATPAFCFRVISRLGARATSQIVYARRAAYFDVEERFLQFQRERDVLNNPQFQRISDRLLLILAQDRVRANLPNEAIPHFDEAVRELDSLVSPPR